MYRDILGFSIAPFMQRVMNINGFFASIMRTGKKSEGSDTALPPGVPIPVLPVDYLKVRPDNWIGGEGSYVCPVDSDWGLWFNFTMNNPGNTAVLPSVKGMNPITGQRVEGYDLQDHIEECPIHKKPFSKGRLCTECGFKWPAQNYISKPNPFYIDGFRTPEGNVRQFYFTEDMAKSVPEQVIGKEDTVPAFGFCFYKLKNYEHHWEGGEHIKGKFPEGMRCGNGLIGIGSRGIGPLSSFVMPGVYTSAISEDHKYEGVSGYSGHPGFEGPKGTKGIRGMSAGGSTCDSYEGRIRSKKTTKMSKSMHSEISDGKMTKSVCYFSSVTPSASMDSLTIGETKTSGGAIFEDSVVSMPADMSVGMDCERGYSPEIHNFMDPVRKSAEVGIGAGAKIKQSFNKSSKTVEDWEKKPAGVLRLYFVFQEEFERYAAAGFNDLKGNKEGYLEGIPVGGSHA